MKYCLSAFLFVFLTAYIAHAETVGPDPSFTLELPDDWNYLIREYRDLTHPTVAHVLDCVNDDPSELKRVGWKMRDGKVAGAYCVSFRKSGMRPAGVLLKYSTGEERERISKSFVDTYASEIFSGYTDRKIRVKDMSADLLEVEQDFILVLDCAISGDTGEYIRSATIVLHDDSLLKIGTVYPVGAPDSVVELLDTVPLSVKWKK